MNKKRLIILILVIIAIWYFASRGKPATAPVTDEQPEEAIAQQVEESTNTDQEQSEAASSLEPVAEGKARVHYFTKEALELCQTNTVALEQTVDPKYGHPAAGALVAQTLPLSAEIADEYISALGAGTRLIVMRIDKEGVATADYNSALNEGLNDCNRAQRRAQIANTLKEFPQIKEVVITVNGQVWE